MKKIIKRLFVIIGILTICCMSFLHVNAKSTMVTDHVEVTGDIIKETLWGGIELERMPVAVERLGSVLPTDEGLVYNWDVNSVVAENNSAIKIASWGLTTANGYKQGTTAQIAKDYELKHPGYMVIAAINGDFFANTSYTSSNGKNQSPSFDPINTWVADGGFTLKKPTVAHPHHNVLGIRLDRSYTYHIGAIYDAQGNPIQWNMSEAEYYTDTNGNQITSISLPNTGENLPVFTDGLIFTVGDYKTSANVTSGTLSEEGVNVLLPGVTNVNVEGFTVIKVYMDRYARPNDGFQSKYWYGESLTNHAYDINYTGLYINGRMIGAEDVTTIESIDDGWCYLATKDESVISQIARGTNVLCQYELTGDVWGDVNSTIGTVLPYILKGERTQYVAKADNYLNDAKPKVVVAFTEDKDCIFFFMGPGELSGSTNTIKGPSSIEVAEMLERLNAYDAFCLDGGGSATIVVRQADGSFATLNNPTDTGGDRSIGNALLMIVEKPNLGLKDVQSTYATFYQSEAMAESTLKSATLHLNGKSYPLVDGEVKVEGLTKSTAYEYYFDYTIENNGEEYSLQTSTYSFATKAKDDEPVVPVELLDPSNFVVKLNEKVKGEYTLEELKYNPNDATNITITLTVAGVEIEFEEGLVLVSSEIDNIHLSYTLGEETKELDLSQSQFELMLTEYKEKTSGGCAFGFVSASVIAAASVAFILLRKKK